MNEQRFQELLQAVVETDVCEEDQMSASWVNTFEEVGVLTRNKGLVVQLQDGSEYQLSIVESKAADCRDLEL